MNMKSILLVFLTFAVLSCDAESDSITSSLFDKSVETSSVVTGPVNMRNGTVRINSPVLFYDSGGSSGSYQNNQNMVLTVYPATSGNRISITLQYFNIENSDNCQYDIFEIYDGTSISAPRIDYWCGLGNSFWIPSLYVASNSSGALTFRFRSDATTTGDGWAATLAQVGPSINYSVNQPKASGLSGNMSLINYTVNGPTQLPTDQGFCISTTSTLPSRTNGADCYTASTNRYGTRVFTMTGITVNTTHYMRGFVTPPGGATIYTTVATYIPTTKAMPDLLTRGLQSELFERLGPLN